MKILVTGGAGYIGSHVVKQLLETTGHDITVLDNLSTGHAETIATLETIAGAGERLRFERMDLAEFDRVEALLERHRYDAVMHFAASIVVPESVSNPLKYYMNNTVNTTHLVAMCDRYGIGRLIFSSTAAVYGEPDRIPIDENAALAPINPYGMSKLMSETVIRDTARANGDFRYVILRYFNVAGADVKGRIGQSFPDATHLIKVAAQTVTGQRATLSIFGDTYPTPDGTCIRDYIHVDDLAKAHLLALEYLENAGASEVFNCGYGHGFSVKEVVEAMRRVSGVDFPAEMAPIRAGDPAELVADSRKIRQTLGWEPDFDDLGTICRSALEWETTLAKGHNRV